ncbi:MAG: hypothetical protein WC506_01490 [Candidatus Micrarchaeia archaeon]
MPKKIRKNPMLLTGAGNDSLLRLAEPEILALDQERVGQILSLASPQGTGRIAARAKKDMLLTAPIKPLSLRGSDPLRLKGKKARQQP